MLPNDLIGLGITIYARFSTDRQRNASAEDQARRCREFVEAHGGAVVDELTFLDRGVSGTSTDRPEYERMMRLVTTPPRRLDVIVVEDLSRLSRDSADLHTVQRLLEYERVRLIGVADGIDTFATHSKLTFGLKSLVSSIYIDDLRDKTMRWADRPCTSWLLDGRTASRLSRREGVRRGRQTGRL